MFLFPQVLKVEGNEVSLKSDFQNLMVLKITGVRKCILFTSPFGMEPCFKGTKTFLIRDLGGQADDHVKKSQGTPWKG